jgi:hypothetical protein
MERYAIRWGCKRAKGGTDVLLGSTGDTEEYIGTVRLEKVPDEVENLLTSRWSSRCIWTFIQGRHHALSTSLEMKLNGVLGGRMAYDPMCVAVSGAGAG